MADFELENRGKKRWCPEVQVVIFIDGTGKVWAYTNRGDMTDALDKTGPLTQCVGPRCGAWVEGPDQEMDAAAPDSTDAMTGRIKRIGTGRCGLKR